MNRRLIVSLVVLALAVSACAYESSGTTTTTTIDPEDVPPATGPADLVFRDQLTDGAGLLMESVTMPSPGFVVLYADDGGLPGDVVGTTRILSAGVIANVPVSFFVPIEGDSVVHAQIHIDMDRDEAFSYEPPDAFIDLPGTAANGEVASVSAVISLLPPIAPAIVTLAEQRTLGDVIEVLAVELPAPGFVVIREHDEGEAGSFLGVSELLPAGPSANVQVTLDQTLDISAILFASIYIDRDGDGILTIGQGSADQIAQGADGLEATIGVPITAVPLRPTQLVAVDQESEGTEVTVTVTVPSPAFVILRSNAAGAPGDVIVVSDLLELGTTDVTFLLDPALTEDTSFWAEVRIDFDGDGQFDETDPLGIIGLDDVARTSFLVTLPVPDDENADS